MTKKIPRTAPKTASPIAAKSAKKTAPRKKTTERAALSMVRHQMAFRKEAVDLVETLILAGEAAGLTRRNLSEKTGIPFETFSRWVSASTDQRAAKLYQAMLLAEAVGHELVIKPKRR